MAQKVWFLTGSSRGFGRYWTEAALQRGDLVAATARNVESLSELVERYGKAVLPLQLVSTASLVVALPANHPLASQQAISLTALSQEVWIRSPRSLNPHWYDDVSLLFQQAGFEPQVVQLTPQPHTLVSQVAAGLGLTIMSTWTQQHLPHPNVVFLPLQGCDYRLEFHVLLRKEDRSPLFQTFLQVLQEFRF